MRGNDAAARQAVGGDSVDSRPRSGRGQAMRGDDGSRFPQSRRSAGDAGIFSVKSRTIRSMEWPVKRGTLLLGQLDLQVGNTQVGGGVDDHFGLRPQRVDGRLHPLTAYR